MNIDIRKCFINSIFSHDSYLSKLCQEGGSFFDISYSVAQIFELGLFNQLKEQAKLNGGWVTSLYLEEIIGQAAEAEEAAEDPVDISWLCSHMGCVCKSLDIKIKQLYPAKPPSELIIDDNLPPTITLRLPRGATLELIYCAPATFLLGSPSNELYHQDDEILSWVSLNRGFYLGKYPVTRQQYSALTGRDPAYFSTNSPQCPVDSVGWYRASAYCAKLNAILSQQLPVGYKLALPSQAEWEYACRSQSLSALNNGQDLEEYLFSSSLEGLGWYDNNSCHKTHPVGEKSANAWGFCDMHGNVWEWCRDLFCECGRQIVDLNEVVVPDKGLQDLANSREAGLRLSRGGSWDSPAFCCRSAYRNYSRLGFCSDTCGFRLAAVFAE